MRRLPSYVISRNIFLSRIFISEYMESLTLLFFLLMMGIFILCVFKRRMELKFLTLIVGVFAMLTALTDPELGDDVMYLLPLDVLIVLISVTWLLFPSEGRD